MHWAFRASDAARYAAVSALKGDPSRVSVLSGEIALNVSDFKFAGALMFDYQLWCSRIIRQGISLLVSMLLGDMG